MRAYRIGRKPMGPWTNRTPPIRGGIFPSKSRSGKVPAESDMPSDPEKVVILDDESHGNTAVRFGSRQQSPASYDHSPEPGYASGRQSTPDQVLQRAKDSHLTNDSSPPTRELVGGRSLASQVTMNPDEWTDWAVRQGQEADFRDYPSLDTTVQQDIADKYRSLHRRIQDEGLYSCRYVEYGKEMLRYTALFVAFLATLRNGWYLTSAIFLGLFWVRLLLLYHLSLPLLLCIGWHNSNSSCCSTKLCSLHMMLVIEPSLKTLWLTH